MRRDQLAQVDRQQFLIDVGGLPWSVVTEVVELLTTEALPQVT